MAVLYPFTHEFFYTSIFFSISVSIIAIGGITPQNTRSVLQAGAKGIAVISAVCSAPDPEEATRKLLEALKKG